jgi:hypothetical protein
VTDREKQELPLFPLQAVLFPGGLLSLKVFEARYLDLMATCLREQSRFGVVALSRGSEVQHADKAVDFASIGVIAELIDVDSAQAGILLVRCRGGERFEIQASRQEADGLWLAETSALPPDEPVAPTPQFEPSVRALAGALRSLEDQDMQPFLKPYRFDDAGWVANRWCEILPISVAAKQKLMALPDALIRLELVDEFLRSHRLIG